MSTVVEIKLKTRLAVFTVKTKMQGPIQSEKGRERVEIRYTFLSLFHLRQEVGDKALSTSAGTERKLPFGNKKSNKTRSHMFCSSEIESNYSRATVCGRTKSVSEIGTHNKEALVFLI